MRNLLTLLSAAALAVGLWLMPQAAFAQGTTGGGNGECTGGFCGKPNQTGGGCSCGCGCSVLIAMTNRGDTYQFADDFDGDGIEDEFDNCPFATNFEQLDADGDEVVDYCDRCANVADPLQANLDGDAFGDACDTDKDGDLVLDTIDNCALVRNESQANTDGDGMGNACDDDDDGDGILDIDDTCRLLAGTAPGAGCDDDEDQDDVFGANDNCPSVYNPMPQTDIDGDGLGDQCDTDKDGDLVPNFQDNCSGVANPSQLDADHDGFGDNGMWPAGPGSCDPTECYVVAGDVDGCLNPNSAFEVQLAMVLQSGDFTAIHPGDDITVAIFSNRLDVNHNWVATFEQLPRGSNVTIENQEGSGTTLDGFPQVANCLRRDDAGTCTELNQIKFTPDAPGTYEMKVTVELPQGDPLGYGNTTAVATIAAEVSGGSASGCASAGGGTGIAALAMGLLAVVRRRRRV